MTCWSVLSIRNCACGERPSTSSGNVTSNGNGVNTIPLENVSTESDVTLIMSSDDCDVIVINTNHADVVDNAETSARAASLRPILPDTSPAYILVSSASMILKPRH